MHFAAVYTYKYYILDLSTAELQLQIVQSRRCTHSSTHRPQQQDTHIQQKHPPGQAVTHQLEVHEGWNDQADTHCEQGPHQGHQVSHIRKQ